MFIVERNTYVSRVAQHRYMQVSKVHAVFLYRESDLRKQRSGLSSAEPQPRRQHDAIARRKRFQEHLRKRSVDFVLIPYVPFNCQAKYRKKIKNDDDVHYLLARAG